MNKISIIIPIYNTANYLDQCLYSIVNQTTKDMQIILINDGSTDNSGEICHRYQELDSRILYIESENEGQGKARIKGISVADAEYIMFVDSDDFLELDAVEHFLEYAAANDADICDFNYYIYDNAQSRDVSTVRHEVKYKGAVNVDTHPEVLSEMSPILCSKIIKKNLITNNKVTMGNYMCEDAVFLAQLYLYANRICQLNYAGYHYRAKREGNISTNTDRYLEINIAVEELVKKIKESEYWDKNWSSIFQIIINLYRDILFRVNGIRNQYGVINQEKYSYFLEQFYLMLDKYFSNKIYLSLLKKKYMVFGSYNLRATIQYMLLDNRNLIKDYSASSIESAVSNDCSSYFSDDYSFTENEYRKRLVRQDIRKDFFKDINKLKPDILIIDLLDEVFELNLIKKDYIYTNSDYIPKYFDSLLPLEKKISFLAPEKDPFFFESASRFCELLNQTGTDIIVVENYLCDKHSSTFDSNDKFACNDYIRKVNDKLQKYYSFIESKLNSPTIIRKDNLTQYRFTHDECQFGCVPYFYNKVYYHKIALEICSIC